MAEMPPLAASGELGALGVMHVKRLWSRQARRRATTERAPTDSSEFILDKIVVYGLGLGLRQAMNALMASPSLTEFERWVLEVNGGVLDAAEVQRINAAVSRLTGGPADPALSPPALAPVLGPAELAAWERDGYVVLHDAAGAAAESAVWQSLGARPDDPDSWYGGPQGRSLWLPLLRHPALDANRRSARIRSAFAQLWGTADLWATIDSAGFNPPERPGWRFPGPHLHWDTSLALPIPLGMQGVLYLTDTAAEQGAFTCVPGFHRRLADWLASLPADADPRQLDRLTTLGPVPIAGRAGDLVIWHHALPHGSRPNHSGRPRIVQYISMFPTAYRDDRPWR
jgi:hypothetical protein